AWAGVDANVMANGWSSIPASGRAARILWRLDPGAVRRERCLLPAYPVPSGALASYAHLPHARLVDRMRTFWRTEVERGARFDLGDPAVETALRAGLSLLLTCRERRAASWVPIGGPLHYRDIWLRDG